MTFTNSNFLYQRAYHGGTMWVTTYLTTTPFTATNVVITDTMAYQLAGGIYLDGSTTQTWTFTSVTVNTC